TMSNHIEFRIVNTLAPSGQVAGSRLQVRTKDVVASVLGLIPLAATWSAWTDVSVEVVNE
ncbi:hypothetical protein, partial [Actinoplanes derwentensis]|uniref:hypothetical protein n=1 Tax=Actinoplanes derwentensis TaxID=113562 RepID=UPI0019411D1F